MKRLALLLLLAAVLCTSGAALARKRADAGSFVVRLTDERASELDHPALVNARRALWECWQVSRPCEVSLSRESSIGSISRQDALLDVTAKGVRSILLRVSAADGRSPMPRRYKTLERIPLVRDWHAPALADTDGSGPEHWRLRFADGEFVRGAGGEEWGQSHDVEVW